MTSTLLFKWLKLTAVSRGSNAGKDWLMRVLTPLPLTGNTNHTHTSSLHPTLRCAKVVTVWLLLTSALPQAVPHVPTSPALASPPLPQPLQMPSASRLDPQVLHHSSLKSSDGQHCCVMWKYCSQQNPYQGQATPSPYQVTGGNHYCPEKTPYLRLREGQRLAQDHPATR